MSEAIKSTSAFVAIVGRPNVGKSSLLNTLVGRKVAIVSDKPQTTRNRIMGIYTEKDAQIVFLDTPGLHTPRTRLGEYMMKAAKDALQGIDALIVMVDATAVGKDVAMQIAALNPRFWDKSQVTDEVLAEEKKIALALMDTDPKMASKPEAVKEKIVMGKMNKFYEENCLLQMEFVRSDIFQGSVEKYIADAAKKLGGSVKFVDAVRFQTGEGIEKKQEDFAAEVAAQMNMGK